MINSEIDSSEMYSANWKIKNKFKKEFITIPILLSIFSLEHVIMIQPLSQRVENYQNLRCILPFKSFYLQLQVIRNNL